MRLIKLVYFFARPHGLTELERDELADDAFTKKNRQQESG